MTGKRYSSEIKSYKSTVTIETIDTWLYDIHIRIKSLEDSNKSLANDNKQLINDNKQLINDNEIKTKMIDELQERLTKIDNQLINSSSSNTIPFSFARIVAGETKDENVKDAEAFVAVAMARVNKEKSLKENNIIVSGIQVSQKANKDEKIEDDKEKVGQVLDILSVSSSDMKSFYRLRRKNDQGNLVEVNQIKVVLKSPEARDRAFKNSKSLKDSEFNHVFINQDLTYGERTILKSLIAKRNKLNSNFLNEKNEKVDYGIDDKNGKKYYWGIRDNELKKIFLKQH
jgi:hypothetical protein